MIVENLDPKLRDFFDEHTNCTERWRRLSVIFEEDYASARVLFLTEVLALIDKWREPTADELNRILAHMLDGGHVVFRSEHVWGILLSVWPLEVAKYNANLLRTFVGDPRYKQYPMTLVVLSSTALVQSWWALETLMNDFGSIIAEERGASIAPNDRLLLDERTIGLDSKGVASDRQNYQPIDARIQFLYRLLTGEAIDRGSSVWMRLMELRNSRDGYVHRLGKPKNSNLPSFLDASIVFDGLKAVQSVVEAVFTKTPEFAERFVYTFLRFWSCNTNSPWIWDGCQGKSFHLGLGKVDFNDIMTLHAPLPAPFGEVDEGFDKQLAAMLPQPGQPTASAKKTGKKARKKKAVKKRPRSR